MVGQACGHGRCALNPTKTIAADREAKTQALVVLAEIVSAADDIHTGSKGLGLASQMSGATAQWRHSLAEGGIKPFDIGGVDTIAAATLGQ